jgi:very-short-patch-repair endonuclease
VIPSLLTAFRRPAQNPGNATNATGAAPTASPAKPQATAPPAPPAAAPAQAGSGQAVLQKRAIDLFTFLRELVSLRTTVVRNCESYDRVLWIDEVPREAECDCVVWSAPAITRASDADDWWLRVRKPSFAPPPVPPEGLAAWADEQHLGDSSQESPRPCDEANGLKLIDHPAVREEWDRYVAQAWRAWADEDRRKRRVLRIYTDLFSLYQQQKSLGEAYEVVVGFGQLRWAPREGVEVNRHLVAVQTNIEFDAQRGVITVGPAAEGAKPRLEEDMLELDERPAPDVLTALEQQVANCDDEDLWHDEQLIGALKSFVHSLARGEGAYGDDLKPLDRAAAVPHARWAPAIILRPRTEQGLLQAYGKILEDLKKRPDVPEGLVPLVEVGVQARPGQEATPAPAPREEDLLFPLHSNEEQREIVNRLTAQSGVVVQGPPGTGKSHTIANLVCHLLATGNRVLVTSHAPRALRILKDKIPQAITNMCVVLLGNDRAALTELESSVQLMTQQLASWNPATRDAAIKEAEQQLAALRARAAQVDKDLRAIREADTRKHPPLHGGYQGTLQEIAQQLHAHHEQHGWVDRFAQGMELEQLSAYDPGIKNAQATQLLLGLRSVDAARRKDLSRELPPPEVVPAPEEFEKFVSEEKHWATTAQQSQDALEPPDAPVPTKLPLPRDMAVEPAALAELADVVDRILRQNSEMESHRFTWAPRLGRDVRAGQYDHWRLLRDQTLPKLEAIKAQPEQVYELEVIHTGEIDIGQFRDDVKVLYDHVEAGGKLSNLLAYVSPARERKYILKDVQIGGKRVKNLATLTQLLAWAEVQYQLHALDTLWSDVSEAPLGPVVRRMPVWTERLALIETAQQMHDSINRARELFGRLPLTRSPNLDDTDELKLLSRQLKVMLARQEYVGRKRAVDALAEDAARRAKSQNAHPVAGRIATAMKQRDLAAYASVCSELLNLRADRERWAQTEGLLKQLAARLPRLGAALSDDPSDAAWDARMAKLNEAWLWLKADRWLKRQLDPRHFEHLQSERKALADHVQAALVKLAAERAWYHCMARMTPAEETYLKAWVQAIKNIGAGTGKRASRFRKVARQTLDRCRSAIPAWIMPIHRVAETVTPGQDRFDVVIVDEASQSGAEALFLHYIAKKIIIVGDDKQIAPYNVGINRDDVELLRSRHIPDLPLTDYFDLDHSFFDQAYLRFGNRIRLCEHFRCMPEIIQFSNGLCYSGEPLLPLRKFGDDRVQPVVVARHVSGGKMEGTSPLVVNRAEADAIVKQIAEMCDDRAYKDKTIGVISLLGEKQARLIEQKLLGTIGPEEMERRRLVCGDAYSFQGDERHVMFISMVVAPGEERRFATLTQPADERRFNVAASRARDQMFLFHSVMPDDISTKCLRRQLLEYCLKPEVPQDATAELDLPELEKTAATADRTRVPAPPPFESWLEVDVYLRIRRRGFRVLPQHVFAGYKIDLVVSGAHGRQAIECNDEKWNGQDRYDADMARQRQLERCGWRFWRIRGGAFYRNPDAALEPLWELLEKQGIEPGPPESAAPTKVDPPQMQDARIERKKAPTRRGDKAA